MGKGETRAAALLVVSLAFLASWIPAGHAEAGAGRQSSDTFGVGERIPTFPTGFAVISSCNLRGSGSIRIQGGVATVTLRATGRLECSDYTYSCDVSRCVIEDQVVTEGVVRREPTGGGTNRPPRPSGSISAQTLTVGGSAVSVNVAQYFTDPDGDALTYTVRSSHTGIATAAVSGSTVTLTPVAAGTATVTVTARDPDGASATQSIAVTVEEDGGTNRPPRPSGSIPAQTLTPGGRTASVNVARYFTDPDGDALTYSARSSRTAIVRASASGSTVTLTPVAAGTATVTVTARDPGGLSVTQSIAVTVEDEGGANALWSSTLTAASFELTGEDGPLRLVGYIRIEGEDGVQRGELSDPDFDFRGAAHHVPGLFQDRDSGAILFIIAPPPDEQDVPSMTLTVDGHALAVSDAGLVDEDDYLGVRAVLIGWRDPGFRWSDGQRIAVQLTGGQDGGANRAPRASGSIPAQTLSVGGRAASVNVARYFTDPDGDALTYTARSSRTGIVTASVSGSTVTLTPVAAGTATVTVTARDPAGLSATQSIAVTVTATGVTAFTDDPLVPGVTPVRAVHFQELRARIDALRARAGLPAFAWTDRTLTPGVTRVSRVHLTELRTALNAAYAAAGRPAPVYTDARVTAGTTPIRASHVAELRAAVVALENARPTGSLAPADQAAFDALVAGKQLTDGTGNRLEFIAPGRVREVSGGESYSGNYRYVRTGANAGTLTYTYDVTGNDPDVERSELRLMFTSVTAGTFVHTYTERGSRPVVRRGSFEIVGARTGESCTNDLGTVSGTVTRSGSWDGSCPSVHYSNGEYARYYTFTLGGRASVTIDLTSPSVDTWLALRNGAGDGHRPDRGRRRRRHRNRRPDLPHVGGGHVHDRGHDVARRRDRALHAHDDRASGRRRHGRG